MAETLACWRCGASLAELSLPLSRRDECPECRAELHVCRMCVHYAPSLPDGCDEEDAPEVRGKENANFCDYFKPSRSAFDAGQAGADDAARAELARLFGEPVPGGTDAASNEASPSEHEPDDALSEAEALFKR